MTLSYEQYDQITRRLDVFAREFSVAVNAGRDATPMPLLAGRAWLARIGATLVPVAVFADATWSFIGPGWTGGDDYHLVAPETVRGVLAGDDRPDVLIRVCTAVLEQASVLADDSGRTWLADALPPALAPAPDDSPDAYRSGGQG